MSPSGPRSSASARATASWITESGTSVIAARTARGTRRRAREVGAGVRSSALLPHRRSREDAVPTVTRLWVSAASTSTTPVSSPITSSTTSAVSARLRAAEHTRPGRHRPLQRSRAGSRCSRRDRHRERHVDRATGDEVGHAVVDHRRMAPVGSAVDAPVDGLDHPGAEHHALEQRVRRQPVGAVHAGARRPRPRPTARAATSRRRGR